MQESYVFQPESGNPACISPRGILEVSLTAVRRTVAPIGANGLESPHSEALAFSKQNEVVLNPGLNWENKIGEGV